MGRSAIIKAAIKERQEGIPAKDVYKTYHGQIKPDNALAMAIASVADPERKQRYAVLNYILVALLILAAITKALSAFFLFPELSPGMKVGVLVLGTIVPLVFAIGIARFDGRLYPLLIVLCFLNAVNIVLRNKESGITVLPDLIMLGAIIVLTFVVKAKVFPNVKLFSVRKDFEGNYVW